MRTVKQMSLLTGVSVRTLHHYDAIGLLKPSVVTEAGYRLYDDTALERMQTILLLRELEFPLKQIQEILDAPNFDPIQALEQQIHLLELRRSHLDRLILHARQIQKTGVISMDFIPFSTDELDAYAAQAKEKWGATPAYQEFAQKTAGCSKAELADTGKALMDIFREFGAVRQGSAASEAAQALVGKLQTFITRHYYTCTKPILQGLGQLYTAGDAMTRNIDQAGGEGTAAFVQQAIDLFCSL